MGLLRRHAYAAAAIGLAGFFLIGFVIVEQLQIPVLTDPRPGLSGGGWAPGTLGVALLIADVVLPVPSSGVMIVQGAAYGLVVGAVLALAGGTGATVVGFLLGRRGGPFLERLAGGEEQERAAALLDRYGLWAVVATRPIPIVAETVAIIAGTGRLPWWQVAGAGALGNLVPAISYAAVGAYAADSGYGLAVFALLVSLAGVVGLLRRRRVRTFAAER